MKCGKILFYKSYFITNIWILHHIFNIIIVVAKCKIKREVEKRKVIVIVLHFTNRKKKLHLAVQLEIGKNR